jgi:hypothetical protein
MDKDRIAGSTKEIKGAVKQVAGKALGDAKLNMSPILRLALIVVASTWFSLPAAADVIADWNEKTVVLVTDAKLGPPQAERVMAMVHVAMFDALNAIEKRYRPYLVQPSASATASKEAAAAVAAGKVLLGLQPQGGGSSKLP